MIRKKNITAVEWFGWCKAASLFTQCPHPVLPCFYHKAALDRQFLKHVKRIEKHCEKVFFSFSMTQICFASLTSLSILEII